MDSFLIVKELKQYLDNFNDDANIVIEDEFGNTDILYSDALGFGGEDLLIINTSKAEMGYGSSNEELEDDTEDFFEDEPFDFNEDDYS